MCKKSSTFVYMEILSGKPLADKLAQYESEGYEIYDLTDNFSYKYVSYIVEPCESNLIKAVYIRPV